MGVTGHSKGSSVFMHVIKSMDPPGALYAEVVTELPLHHNAAKLEVSAGVHCRVVSRRCGQVNLQNACLV